MDQEESFPRGGKKRAPQKRHHEKEHNLFQDKVPKVKKRRQQEKRKDSENVVVENIINNIQVSGTLAYNKIQEGMVILSCIRNITDCSLELEFPGLTYAHVDISCISEPLTKYLSSSLADSADAESCFILKKLFKVGQFVPAKVLSIEGTTKGYRVKASINPSDINSEKWHNSFKKGFLVWTAVVSELEHGYQLTTGISNCRVFLPSKNIDEGRTYHTGEPLWCVVHKFEEGNVATTLKVSAKKEHVDILQIDEDVNLHDIIPGTKVEFFVEKVLKHGLQGKYLNKYFGYVDESQLVSPLDKLERIKEGKLYSAYVLYVEQATKITHLSLRGIESVAKPQIKKGQALQAEVFSRAKKGIYVKLGKTDKGYVPNKRLINNLSKNSPLDIKDVIAKKYPVGSKHHCRILNFNYIERTHICTFEQQILQEKFVSYADFIVGQSVNGVITEVLKAGLQIKVGQVKGFVPNLHLTNVEYTENIKKKFPLGMKVRAKVLKVEDDNILFTLKPALIENDRCLAATDNVEPNSVYPAVVIKAKSYGIFVSFYGHMNGFIPLKEFNFLVTDDYKRNPSKYFFNGQVINVRVINASDDKLKLSLKLEVKSENEVSKPTFVGEILDGIVAKICDDGLNVTISARRGIGFVPMAHLGQDPTLCPAILKTYTKGDKITNLLCIRSGSEGIILSKRESEAFKKHNIKIPKFQHIKRGYILRCSFEKSNSQGIYVSTPMRDYSQLILIEKKDISSKSEVPAFIPQQSIVAKVTSIDSESKVIKLTAKLNEVFNKDVQYSLDLFIHSLEEEERLRQHSVNNNGPLTEYGIGERVICTVKKLGNKGGCLVTLPNNCNGLVAPQLCTKNPKCGQQIKGLVLAYDFIDNYIEICLKPNIIEEIRKSNKNSSVTFGDSYVAERLLVRNDFVLGMLKREAGKQLIYMPLKLHENDTETIIDAYQEPKFKVVVCKKYKNKLIAIPKSIKKDLDKQHTKLQEVLKIKKARLLANSEEQSDEYTELSENSDEDDESQETQESVNTLTKTSEEDTLTKTSEDDESEMDVASIDSDEENEAESLDEKLIRTPIVSLPRISFGDSTTKVFDSSDRINCPVLPGVGAYFKTPQPSVFEDSSSEEDDQESAPKKKKKLTPAERAEQAKLEEERLSKIERELADSVDAPQSSEQFDRLLMANPNSAELWARYASFYASQAEFDKARTVVKRSLETINPTLIEEKQAMWTFLMGLENTYGTKESFENVFNDALKYNDTLEIYLKAVDMLAESGKFAEMEEKIKRVKSKHKQDPNMWLKVAETYYKINKCKEARNMKDGALKSIIDKKIQLNLIVKFAILEFHYGETDVASAIFDTLLQSDPRKVNFWCTYVDQLVKKNHIEEARKVLERAVCQKLPIKSMNSLFSKFRRFEEEFGTPETIQEVVKRAHEYVNKVK